MSVTAPTNPGESAQGSVELLVLLCLVHNRCPQRTSKPAAAEEKIRYYGSLHVHESQIYSSVKAAVLKAL